ncbi:MAG: phosphatidate cytidylyltransferase [Variibacter sp.]|jgi:phosphatidate cytidylyltransferase|nr:phosphatidate cytidylyltransferase [Variibacter sp.]
MQENPPPASGLRARVGGDLALRVVSALVLIPLALAAAFAGGVPFALFWLVAALAVLWEWITLLSPGARAPLIVGGAALVGATLLVLLGYSPFALLVLLLGTIAAALTAADRRSWAAAGVPYAGAIVLAPLLLRIDEARGLLAIVLLFAVVWLTDIMAYFAGRLIGGPKLWPRVSPKKTWSGALAGTAAAMIGGVAVASLGGAPRLWPVAIVCALLSAVSQGGDLFESALKRRVGAKDASQLIPGHGGVMDRLDGFVMAAACGALIGVLRGGPDGPARGLMIW